MGQKIGYPLWMAPYSENITGVLENIFVHLEREIFQFQVIFRGVCIVCCVEGQILKTHVSVAKVLSVTPSIRTLIRS